MTPSFRCCSPRASAFFTAKTPKALEGTTVAASQVRSMTGCSIIATDLDGKRRINPDTDTVIHEGRTLIMIESLEAEEKFFEIYKPTL